MFCKQATKEEYTYLKISKFFREKKKMNGIYHDQVFNSQQKVKFGKLLLFDTRYIIISLILVVRLYIL